MWSIELNLPVEVRMGRPYSKENRRRLGPKRTQMKIADRKSQHIVGGRSTRWVDDLVEAMGLRLQEASNPGNCWSIGEAYERSTADIMTMINSVKMENLHEKT